MLVLTRKTNQSIMIGNEIEITVLAISDEQVQIGIQAPREIPVFRQKVYLNIQAQRQATAGDGRARAIAGRHALELQHFRRRAVAFPMLR